MQVEEAHRAVLFKELGSSTGEAKDRIEAELKKMQEQHAEADEMRTLYIEEAQVAWKKLKVAGPGTERFLAEFGHTVYPPTMLELQKYSGILKKAVEMATLKADLELFAAELKEAAAMPQNNKVLKDEKKKRCAFPSSVAAVELLGGPRSFATGADSTACCGTRSVKLEPTVGWARENPVGVHPHTTVHGAFSAALRGALTLTSPLRCVERARLGFFLSIREVVPEVASSKQSILASLWLRSTRLSSRMTTCVCARDPSS